MIWLIGCKGMLGTELSLLLEKYNLPFIGTDCEVDITDLSALNSFAENKSFKWIINCAAYTAVDKAEDDIDNCRRINTLGALNISICSRTTGAYLIHISTDYVFDGKGIIAGKDCRPYREDDITNPIGVYGLTKRDGELAVLVNNSNSYIIRTSWLYGIYGNNFVKTMLRLMNVRNEIKVVDDQRGSPTWAYDLAFLIFTIINDFNQCNKNHSFGIYHFSNDGAITWYEFSKEIYKQGKLLSLINNNCNILPCSSNEYPSKVTRPTYSVLDKSKIKKMLNIAIPLWHDSLNGYLKLCII